MIIGDIDGCPVVGEVVGDGDGEKVKVSNDSSWSRAGGSTGGDGAGIIGSSCKRAGGNTGGEVTDAIVFVGATVDALVGGTGDSGFDLASLVTTPDISSKVCDSTPAYCLQYGQSPSSRHSSKDSCMPAHPSNDIMLANFNCAAA